MNKNSHTANETLADWLREHAPDCGDNSCLFGGKGKGGMRTNGGCRCFRDMRPTMKRIFVERLFAFFEANESAASETRRSIPIADIERQIEDITKNGISLAKFGGDEAVEGRCRELCAMYLREFILTHRMSEQLAELDKPETSAPCVARRAVEEIKAIIQKHVPLPGWAYEDEIVRVVRECERPGE